MRLLSFTQYSYYHDFFCSGPASRLRDCYCHMWVCYIDTTIIKVCCISSVLIHMTCFSVFTIFVSDIYRAIVSYIPTSSQQLSAILWNITITVWCFCETVKFLLSTVIVVTPFVRGHHFIFNVAIVTCKCDISILRKLGFVVCHRY